jgi:flagellar motility protein MotE (MotC chaperone)
MTAPTTPPPITRKARRRGGRGALFLLAILLAASGAMRLGLGIGEAMARAPSDAAAADEGHSGATAETAGGVPLDCPAPPMAVVEALQLREARLATQEAALADRIAALALTETAVTGRLAELERAEAALSETLARSDGAAEGDLARLTTVYETMKPKDASALFAAMDAEFAAGFLGRMKPEAAAAILAGMQPDAAYAVSVLLAGRNALVPRE